jgi:hypothetical protein
MATSLKTIENVGRADEKEGAMKGRADANVIEATGTAATGRRRGPNLVEAAMASVITDASKETEAIWKRTDLDEAEKRKQIDAIMHPAELLRRKMEVRANLRAARGAASGTSK